MGNISVQVINEKDYEMVMAALKPLIDNKTILVLEEDKVEDSIALPGKPLTNEQWVQYIEKAESEPTISEEEMKAIFKYLKMTTKSKTAA